MHDANALEVYLSEQLQEVTKSNQFLWT